MTTDPTTTSHVVNGSRSNPSPAGQAPAGQAPAHAPRKSLPLKLLHLPGVMACGAYMLLLAVVAVVGVVDKHFPPFCLVFPVFFIAAGLGLFLLLRWAWALTLAAVAMLAGLFLWSYSTEHSFPALAQGLLNLVIFLYLVRADLREKLR